VVHTRRLWHHALPLVLAFLAVQVLAHADGAAIRPERGPTLILDSFETDKPAFSKWTRGKLTARLDAAATPARHGTRCLAVGLEPTGTTGRNSVVLTWTIARPHEWAKHSGLALWIRCDTPAPGITLSVAEATGAHYWRKLAPHPRRIGQWQLIKLPWKAWSWSWEAKADANKRLDVEAVSRLIMELRADAKERRAFALDGLGLYHEEPPYTGPTVALHAAREVKWRTIQAPGQDHRLALDVDRLPEGRHAEVHLLATDYWGTTRLDKTFAFTGAADGKKLSRSVVVANTGPSYIDLVATLRVDGRDVYRSTCAVACIAPMAPEDAEPNEHSIFGIWVGGGRRRIGASWSRTYCRGTDVKLVDGQYQFQDNPPGVYKPRRSEGLHYTFYFSKMPKWLSSKPDRPDFQKWKPRRWEDYDRLLQWVIRGAKDGGFKYYEVWNEPVPYAYWMGTLDDVVKLHEVTYKAIKKVQPDAVVLGPCPYTFKWDFLETYFTLGGGKWIDHVVVHAYGPPPDVEFAANIRRLRAMMRTHGLGDRGIFITEMGYPTPKYTEREQAQFLVRAYAYALSEGVRLLTWHMLWDWSPGGDPGHAILRHDHTPRPAYPAYATLTRMLENARFVAPVKLPKPTQRGFRFTRRGHRIAVLWDTGDRPTRYDLADDAAELRVVDLMGGERALHPIKGQRFSLTLTGDPIYAIARIPPAGGAAAPDPAQQRAVAP